MSYIDYTPLRLGIIAYKQAKGTYVDLARCTDNQVSNSTIARIAKGAIAAPSLDLWLALHQAAPQYIPLPELTPTKGRKSAAVWASGLLPRLAGLNRAGQGEVEALLLKLEKKGKPAKAARPKTVKPVKPKTVKPAKTAALKSKKRK